MLCALSHKTRTQSGRLGDTMDLLQRSERFSGRFPSLLHRISSDHALPAILLHSLRDRVSLFYNGVLLSIKAAKDVVVTGSPIRHNYLSEFPIFYSCILFPFFSIFQCRHRYFLFQSFTDSLCIFFIRGSDHIRGSKLFF